MNRRVVHLLALVGMCAVVAALTSACSNTVTDAATVTYRGNTVHISLDDFQKELRAFVGSKHFPDLVAGNPQFAPLGDGKNVTNPDVTASYLTQLIQNAPFEAEFDRLHLKTDTAVLDTARKNEWLAFSLANERKTDATGQQTMDGPGVVFSGFSKSIQNLLVERQARLQAVIDYYTKNVTPAKVQSFYKTYEHDICPSGRVVSHILVKDSAVANQLYGQLQQGASFAQLAQAKSIDTSSAKNGGRLGCLSQGEFVKDFETPAFAATFDQPTRPVKSQFGYHIILVQKASYPLLQSETQSAFRTGAFLTYQTKAEHVYVNPRYGTAHLETDQQGAQGYVVVPPSAPAPRDVRENRGVSTTTVPLG